MLSVYFQSSWEIVLLSPYFFLFEGPSFKKIKQFTKNHMSCEQLSRDFNLSTSNSFYHH